MVDESGSTQRRRESSRNLAIREDQDNAAKKSIMKKRAKKHGDSTMEGFGGSRGGYRNDRLSPRHGRYG